MKICYDDDLTENAVFQLTIHPAKTIAPDQHRQFHKERELCYSTENQETREQAFKNLHLRWFYRWGLAASLENPAREFPLLQESLQILAFRKARGKNDEGAELYVTPDQCRNGVVALRGERLQNKDSLDRWLRHELAHLQDMVDPAFDYSPVLDIQGPLPQRVVRDRYRLLWAISVDGRLCKRGHQHEQLREQYLERFDQAYGFLADDKRLSLFNALWENPTPNHSGLLALARDPRNLSHAPHQLQGGHCSVCGFPTFAWTAETDLKPDLIKKIQAIKPGWTTDQGICQRCTEVYTVTNHTDYPSTVCL